MLTPKNYIMKTRLIFSLLGAFLLFTFSGCSNSEEYESSQMKVDVELSNSKIQGEICGDFDEIGRKQDMVEYVADSLTNLNITSWTIQYNGGKYRVYYLWDFNDIVSNKTNAIAFFYSTWSGVSKMISPTFNALSEEYSGKIAFLKINVDDDNTDEISNAYGIIKIPTFLFFKDHRLVDRIIGANPEMLRNKILKYFM